jgi:hypothetical protein
MLTEPEHVGLSVKTGSDRRAVRTTQTTRERIIRLRKKSKEAAGWFGGELRAYRKNNVALATSNVPMRAGQFHRLAGPLAIDETTTFHG